MSEFDADELKRRIDSTFPVSADPPSVSLRAGNALDDYRHPPPFDAGIDAPTADYLEQFHYGIHFLDPESWLHYLPVLLAYSIEQAPIGTSGALDTFFYSLRPPDTDPPRFAPLSPAQRALVADVLTHIGFSPESQYQDEALLALQEYWDGER